MRYDPGLTVQNTLDHGDSFLTGIAQELCEAAIAKAAEDLAKEMGLGENEELVLEVTGELDPEEQAEEMENILRLWSGTIHHKEREMLEREGLESLVPMRGY